MSASMALSMLVSVYCYVSSFVERGAMLASGGCSGNPVYDAVIGEVYSRLVS